jgi:ketosteroid isomerase-like protein
VINRKTIYVSWVFTLAMMASPSWCAEASSDSAMQAEVRAVYARFVAGQNAHDPSVISEVLVKSRDFVWAQGGGRSIWGFDEALAAWKSAWNGSWHLDPQLNELRIARIAPGVALLITPMLLTSADPGEQPSTDPVRWGGVFVKTESGWRISSMFITPYPNWVKH